MATKTKGRNGGDRAARKAFNVLDYSLIRNLINLVRSRIKQTVMFIVTRGLIPYRVAEFIIQRGGLRDA